jgi:hypothetical protein
MTYKPKNGGAPSDAEAEKAWDEIMKIASKHGLIIQAYGGAATLALPQVQRRAGLRERVLRAGLFELEGSGSMGA